ncbi:MAG: UDP-N-acetylmuramate--L-alanine ligase [Candidatus Aegiribacteria sp.]|nr:UDP-N-acetylmuramate--L-alanine ligase [Candidatus Aegiribacteria sp.]
MTSSVHLIGICGSGMSSLALWYRYRGFEVSGCDRSPGSNLLQLLDAGIAVSDKHDPLHVEKVGRVVFSAAIPVDHPEIVFAREKGVPVLRRSEALAELANDSHLLAVAGAHGKTTTTAMTGWILQETGHDPTVMVGGTVSAWGGNFRPGSSLTVVEADEYDRAFLRLKPVSAAVTSFAIEHLECYGTPEALSVAFGVFLEMTRPGGTVIVPFINRDLAKWAERIERNVITTGPEGSVFCRPLETDKWRQKYMIDGIQGYLPLPGNHNLRNAEAAIALASTAGVSTEDSAGALESFPGVSRRLERIGNTGSAVVLSDYAHHPDEIEAALQGVSQVSQGKIVVVFEPHLYSRTAVQYEAAGIALSRADMALVLPIYPAREKPIPGITSQLVVDASVRAGGNCELCTPVNVMKLLLEMEAEIIVFMGAGSIDSLARELVEDAE